VTAPRTGIAQRLWEASRREFSVRGYHGARVQGIARGAGCNVALLYRHWNSKKALYLDVLRSIWAEVGKEIAQVIENGPANAPVVVGAYLDAMMRDPIGAQIFVRELIDGGPFLSQLAASEPSLTQPARRAAAAMVASPDAYHLRPGLDPILAILTVAGLAALAASAHEATRPYLDNPVTPETWREHLYDLLLHGLLPGGAIP
jgi:TetR/AcrR family transcriptional regulator